MTALSKTDKTRPWRLKEAEVKKADPYRARRQEFMWVHSELIGCPDSCWMCVGWRHDENRRTRRRGKDMARNWQKEYE